MESFIFNHYFLSTLLPLSPCEGRLETSTRHSTEECITSVQNATTKDSCASFALCDPQHWAHRSIALSMVCIINFGSNFVYDNPVSLQSTIINVRYNFRPPRSETKFENCD